MQSILFCVIMNLYFMLETGIVWCSVPTAPGKNFCRNRKMKVKSLHYSKVGNAQIISGRLGEIYKCVSDQIPPAYPCESEKIVFIGIETSKKIDRPVVDFCKTLTPARAQNVAFYIIGGSDTSGLDPVKQAVQANGVNVAGDTLVIPVKSGLFKKGRISDSDVETAVKWAADITDHKLK